ncbi:phosphatase PAP2 family protein [Streptacidiphilus sp. EB103A]|uniref:phosphatase PAP2 family protein n=1 Tax=Streptacidiphilus sp. EB103A TaxID=3156275 RepID=UPI00351252A3
MAGRSAHAAFPSALRGWLGPVAALAALVVVVLGVRYAGHHQAGTVDGWIRSAVVGVRPPGWQSVALDLDALGEPTGAVTLVVTLVVGCLLLRRPRAAVLTGAGAGLAVVTSSLLKHVVGRTIHGENLSYPSGHTAFATALALAVALLAAERLGRPAGFLLVLTAALVGGAAMGWAEIALDAHYPTDVLGGWCTALAVVPATAWLVDWTADVGRRVRR